MAPPALHAAKPQVDPAEPVATPTPEVDPDAFALVTAEPPWEVTGKATDTVTVELASLTPGLNSSHFQISEGRPPAESDTELPKGFTAVKTAGVSPEGLPLRIVADKDDVEMALVPAGVFTRGIEGGPENAGPAQAVLLGAFYMDVHEVTVGQYEEFRAAVLKSEKKRINPSINSDSDPANPALGLNWSEAHFYARWVGKELPTETQWERAGRSSHSFQFPWGNGRPIWNRVRRPGQIDRVGSFRGDLSPDGIFDLAGNAREWCADWYSETTYAQELATGETTLRNPKGLRAPSSPNLRVVRGGAPDWSLWQRTGVLMGERPADVGFRCVLNLPDADDAREPDEKPKRPELRPKPGEKEKPAKPPAKARSGF
jgi:hypothetical protein